MGWINRYHIGIAHIVCYVFSSPTHSCQLAPLLRESENYSGGEAVYEAKTQCTFRQIISANKKTTGTSRLRR